MLAAGAAPSALTGGGPGAICCVGSGAGAAAGMASGCPHFGHATVWPAALSGTLRCWLHLGQAKIGMPSGSRPTQAREKKEPSDKGLPFPFLIVPGRQAGKIAVQEFVVAARGHLLEGLGPVGAELLPRDASLALGGAPADGMDALLHDITT